MWQNFWWVVTTKKGRVVVKVLTSQTWCKALTTSKPGIPGDGRVSCSPWWWDCRPASASMPPPPRPMIPTSPYYRHRSCRNLFFRCPFGHFGYDFTNFKSPLLSRTYDHDRSSSKFQSFGTTQLNVTDDGPPLRRISNSIEIIETFHSFNSRISSLPPSLFPYPTHDENPTDTLISNVINKPENVRDS